MAHADLTAFFADSAAARAAAAALLRDAGELQGSWNGDVDACLHAYSALSATRDELEAYAHLRLLASADQDAFDLRLHVQEVLAEFGELAGPIERALLDVGVDAAPARWRPWLEQLHRHARAELGEEAETAWNAREATADAWITLYRREIAEVPLGEGMRAFAEPDDRLRRAALQELEDALAARADVIAACYDALVADRIAFDRLHGYADPLAATLLVDQVDTAEADELERTLVGAYPLARQLYDAKRRRLGRDAWSSDAMHLPWGELPAVSWDEAVADSISAFAAFSPRLGEAAARIFALERVESAPGGIGGACAVMGSARVPAYVAVDFDGTFDSRLVLVHELGHAVHFMLALEQQPQLLARVGTATAEIAALVAEELLFRHLEARASADDQRLLRATRLERWIGATLHQTMMVRFERRAYDARSRGEALTAPLLSGLWLEERAALYGQEVEVGPPSRLSWTYVGHFFTSRCGEYAYPYACLAALALLADPSPAAVEDLLAAGASRPPRELLRRAGLGSERDVWGTGLAALSELAATVPNGQWTAGPRLS